MAAKYISRKFTRLIDEEYTLIAQRKISFDTRILALRGQVEEKQEQRGSITTEISRLTTWLEGVNSQATRLRLESIIIREIGESPNADLYNPSLEGVLEKYADDCQRALLGKTVEGAADRRIVEHCRNHVSERSKPASRERLRANENRPL